MYGYHGNGSSNFTSNHLGRILLMSTKYINPEMNKITFFSFVRGVEMRWYRVIWWFLWFQGQILWPWPWPRSFLKYFQKGGLCIYLVSKFHECSLSGLENIQENVIFQLICKFPSKIQDGRQKKVMGQYFFLGTSKFIKYTYWGV